MLYEKDVKGALEDVRLTIPHYVFEVSDINEALDPVNGGGNCGAVTYMGLLSLEDRLGTVPGFYTQFGFMPHTEKEGGKVIVGHALGRFDMAGRSYVFNQTRDGDIRIGPAKDFDIDERTLYYPTDEGYGEFIRTLYEIYGDEAPSFDRDEVLKVFKKTLALKKGLTKA